MGIKSDMEKIGECIEKLSEETVWPNKMQACGRFEPTYHSDDGPEEIFVSFTREAAQNLAEISAKIDNIYGGRGIKPFESMRFNPEAFHGVTVIAGDNIESGLPLNAMDSFSSGDFMRGPAPADVYPEKNEKAAMSMANSDFVETKVESDDSEVSVYTYVIIDEYGFRFLAENGAGESVLEISRDDLLGLVNAAFDEKPCDQDTPKM